MAIHKSDQFSQRIRDVIEADWSVRPDRPWPDQPRYEVFRHQLSGKWFGVMMVIAGDKIGLDGPDPAAILNLKGDPLQIRFLLCQPGFRPAWHMNKKHWFTVLLDGTVGIEPIRELIRISHGLTE